MLTYNEFSDMLDDLTGEIPREYFVDLNGGVVLSKEVKIHPQSSDNDLFIMGEYHKNRTLGRTVFIYYGSFARCYSHLSDKDLRARVRKTLLHEFTHHLESLAGERDLEIEDEIKMAQYKSRKRT